MRNHDQTVLVFGSTGTAGSGAIRACLDDPRVGEVRAVSRRPLPVGHEKLRQVLCDDFLDLGAIAEDLRGVDICLYCLGVSAVTVPDEAEYRVIHVDYPVAACRALAEASPEARLVYLSGQGAKTGSRMMWARVKAEAETTLAQEKLAVACVRPGYIHPTVPSGVKKWILGPLLAVAPPLGIRAAALGKAMLSIARDGCPADVPVGNRALRARN